MKNLSQTLKSLTIALILVGGISYVFAWTGPSTTPPNGNVSAPINVGSSDQTKAGRLGTSGYSAGGGYPPGWSGGIHTWDIYGEGTIGVGQNGAATVVMNSTGGYLAAQSLISNIDVTSPKYCIGTDCITSWAGVGGGTPSGAVMAFYLSSCPSGWKAADGTNGTPDLRGYFVRGLGTNSDGTASGALGAKVADEYRSHSHSGVTGGIETHTYSANDSKAQRGTADKTVLISLGGAVSYPQSTLYINPSGGSETRPKNIALLYCQKN
ncbi:MAG: hypothetical protein WCO12_03230 [bacterium]